MDALQLLEQKISSLIAVVDKLKKENDKLIDELAMSKNYQNGIKADNERLSRENTQLCERNKALESQMNEEMNQINVLNEEKELTKLAVDDLLKQLKSIDFLVEKQ